MIIITKEEAKNKWVRVSTMRIPDDVIAQVPHVPDGIYQTDLLVDGNAVQRFHLNIADYELQIQNDDFSHVSKFNWDHTIDTSPRSFFDLLRDSIEGIEL